MAIHNVLIKIWNIIITIIHKSNIVFTISNNHHIIKKDTHVAYLSEDNVHIMV